MSQPDPEIESLIAAGRKIDAIRLYRERYGVGLVEAKDAVEALERGRVPAPKAWVAPASSRAPAEWFADDPAFAAEIETLLRNGQKIQAIKQYRERSGVGLKEAKDAVDARAAELGMAAQSRCFIATVAYGNDMDPEVQTLRIYRDVVLSRSALGRAFVRAYYRVSPCLAAWIARSEARAARARWLLRPLVERCRRTLERTEGRWEPARRAHRAGPGPEYFR